MRGRRKRLRGWAKWAFISTHLLLAATAVLAFTLEWEDESVGLIDWIILAMCPAIVTYLLYTVRVGLRV